MSEGTNAWLAKDETIFHPDIWPDSQHGASLQDVRNYYLRSGEKSLKFPLKEEPWFITTPDAQWRSSLCEYCVHIDFKWLARNRTPQNRGPILWLKAMLKNRDTCSFCGLAIKALCNTEIEHLQPHELEMDDQVLCCWIMSEDYSGNTYDGSSFQVSRRVLAVTSGWIGLVGSIEEVGHDDDRSPGRLIPLSGANESLIKKWVRTCELFHEDGPKTAQYDEKDESSLQLRLVDVNQKCIVKAEPLTRYVALSYVWGRVTQLRLLLENEKLLGTPGALQPRGDGVQCTRTILDAIEFTRATGEQYLWIDALCLVQDGPDFAAQVQNMEAIYTGAAWTLIAGSASDANCQLGRNLNSINRTIQEVAKVRDRDFAVVLPSLQLFLQSSPWSKRAWTYQESVLSKILVYLTDSQVYFSCRHGYTLCEDTKFEDNEPLFDERLGHIFGRTVGRNTNFATYAEAVEEYTSRQISFHEDALNAVTGVLNFLRQSFRSEFQFGLPSTELDQALLWYPHPASASMTRRKDVKGKVLFPSWSWVGWVGPCQYRAGLVLSRIKWKISASGEETHMSSEALRRPASRATDLNWQQTGWREHYLEDLEDAAHYFWDYDSSWYEEDEKDTLYVHPIASSNRASELLSMTTQTGHLAFKALVCAFQVTGTHAASFARWGLPCLDRKHELCSLNVYTQRGTLCGTIHVPGSIAGSLETGLHQFVRLSRTHLSTDETSYREWPHDYDEFETPNQQTIAESLAEQGYEDGDAYRMHNEIGPEDSFGFDQDIFWVDCPWGVYNVMLIETKGGVSHRLGIGKVHIDAFFRENEDSEPEWRDIILG